MARGRRVLVYSHDSFGLGHLRRCRVVAHTLVEHFPDLSVLILSGSPIVGSFEFRARVDFVRIPGVIKLRNGAYTSLALHIDVAETLAIRRAVVRATAEAFRPDLFLVDKEPTGLRGEVLETLRALRRRGCRLVLGLRDIMDDPLKLVREWRRKRAWQVLAELYDEIWVYGVPEMFDVVAEIPGMRRHAAKIAYVGYLPRRPPREEGAETPPLPAEPFLLVTTGGGRDGEALMDWVLAAYEADPAIPWPAMLVFGPFMRPEARRAFAARAARDPRLSALTFDNRPERLYARAAGVVAMGGYNTFCEILSFDRPALIVPRTRPRREQAIRAERAARLGLVRVLDGEGPRDPAVMARALHELPHGPRPGARGRALLSGERRLVELAAPVLAPAEPRRRAAGGLA